MKRAKNGDIVIWTSGYIQLILKDHNVPRPGISYYSGISYYFSIINMKWIYDKDSSFPNNNSNLVIEPF